jgi:hypothetical protein
MFALDNDIVIEDDVIEDIWFKSNGYLAQLRSLSPYLIFLFSHPGMLCLCGRVISDRLKLLLEHDSHTLVYRKWLQTSVQFLYDDIMEHPIFFSMVKRLCLPDAKPAVQLLRSHFAGFLGFVTLSPSDAMLADFLTTEGVLLRPDLAQTRYCMASPLIDGLIKSRVIPAQFRSAPSIAPPMF